MEESNILTQAEKKLESVRSEIAILSNRIKSHENPAEKCSQDSTGDTTADFVRKKTVYASQLMESITDLKEVNLELAAMIDSNRTFLNELLSHCDTKEAKAQELVRKAEETLEIKRKLLHNLRCLKEGVSLYKNFDNDFNSESANVQSEHMLNESGKCNVGATPPSKAVKKSKEKTEFMCKSKYDTEQKHPKSKNEERLVKVRKTMQIELQKYAASCEERSAELWQNKMSLLHSKVKQKEKENEKLVQQIKRERLVINARYNLGQQLPQLRKKFHDDFQQDSNLDQCPHFESLKKEVSHLFQEIYRESEQQYIKTFDHFLTGVIDLMPVPGDQIINAYRTE